MNNLRTLAFEDEKLSFINQTKLPLIEEYISTDDYERIAMAIERLEIRGAPAIGVAAAYALALSVKNKKSDIENMFFKAYDRLASTRPTAVNLFWALNKIKEDFTGQKENPDIYNILISSAHEIFEEDRSKCEKIGKNGAALFRKKSRVLTHCNAGSLATTGDGTAISVIKSAYGNDLVELVYVDETRPLLQGLRLTAFELHHAGIPFKVITDSTAAFLMQQDEIDLVITGADRIALNGDTANKIGTYNLAVLCRYHNIPFYVAAPLTTFDKKCKNGADIKIEQRDKKEILQVNGISIAPDEFDAYTPAFDVTPSDLISAIITDNGVVYPPYNF